MKIRKYKWDNKWYFKLPSHCLLIKADMMMGWIDKWLMIGWIRNWNNIYKFINTYIGAWTFKNKKLKLSNIFKVIILFTNH